MATKHGQKSSWCKLGGLLGRTVIFMEVKVNRGQMQCTVYALPVWYLMSRWGLGPKVHAPFWMWYELNERDITWLWRKKWNLVILNFCNGNAFLNIVILYYLLMRQDVWFENHLVCKKGQNFVQFEPYDFVQILPAYGLNTYQIMYGETLDFQCQHQQW